METNTIPEKAPDRLAALAKIEEYERKGWFTKDIEEDPPTIPLEADKVDYLNKKISNKILTKVVNAIARKFIRKLIKDGQLIIKNVKNLETFAALKDEAAIITCNHFNAFDNFAVYISLEKYIKHRELYKVIREGNYTNFPGMFGVFFRHCNTLPLSENFSTQKKFMEAVDVLLQRKEKILVYAEQGMWWNYRKPRPVTKGAFKFAAKNKVPVIPLFITMEDSDKIGGDGFPIQEYTLHVLEPIYPDLSLTERKNIEMMMEKNNQEWKDCYEKTYGIPLTYTTETKEE